MSGRDAELVASVIQQFHNPVVVEYGAGWSTVAFSPFARRYITIETSKEWADIASSNCPHHVTIMRCSSELQPHSYASIPFEDVSNTPVEVAFVDGHFRKDVVNYLRDNRLARVVLLHDAHRGSPEMERFHYHAKIGDDFFIGMHEHPEGKWAHLMQKFDARPMDWPSVPWHETHVGEMFSPDGRKPH